MACTPILHKRLSRAPTSPTSRSTSLHNTGFSLHVPLISVKQRNETQLNALLPTIKTSREDDYYIKGFQSYFTQKVAQKLAHKSCSLISSKTLVTSVAEGISSTIDEQAIVSQNQTPKAVKPDPLEQARQKYLEKNKSVELAVKKVRKKMKFQNEDHESKFSRRMSAFSNLNTYFNISEFLSKLGKTESRHISEKKIPRRPPLMQQVKNPNVKSRNLSVRESTDEPTKTQETEGSRTERDTRTNYRDALNINLEELRKKKARNDHLHLLLNEDSCPDTFDDKLADQLLKNQFDAPRGDPQNDSDQTAIKKIEALRQMLHARHKSENFGVEVQREHLQNFKRRSDKVIGLLKRAAKNIYNRSDDSNKRASSLQTLPQNTPKEKVAVKPGEASSKKIEPNKEMKLFELTSINFKDPSRIKGESGETKEIMKFKGKENVPSLFNLSQAPSRKSTARASSNSVKENKKINTAYGDYLQVILSQTDEEKKSIERAREAIAKKTKK